MTTELNKHNELFENTTPTRLFAKCAFPSMVSMGIMSLYTIVDGIFVGRFIGAEALAAINLIMPLVAISFALSDMVAVGSSVQIGIHLGEKKNRDAGIIFTSCSLVIIGISCILGVLGFLFSDNLIRFMGADPLVTALSVEYVKVFCVFAPFVLVFFAVDNYLRTCGKVNYSMVVNILVAVLNIFLDFLFLAVLKLGIGYAALASCLSLLLGTLLCYLPFARKKLPLRFVKGRLKAALFKNILFNGASEFFSNIAGSILLLVINSILLHISGSMAVAAFSVVMYVDSIVCSMLYGMTDSMQPPISYCYGAGLRKRMFSIEKRVLIASAFVSILAFVIMRTGGENIIALFVKEDNPALLEMSVTAMTLYSLKYFFTWIDTSLTAFFTAVNRPGISLGISLGKAFFFPIAIIFILVKLLGLNGVWLTAPACNILTAITTVILFIWVLKKENKANQ